MKKRKKKALKRMLKFIFNGMPVPTKEMVENTLWVVQSLQEDLKQIKANEADAVTSSVNKEGNDTTVEKWHTKQMRSIRLTEKFANDEISEEEYFRLLRLEFESEKPD